MVEKTPDWPEPAAGRSSSCTSTLPGLQHYDLRLEIGGSARLLGGAEGALDGSRATSGWRSGSRTTSSTTPTSRGSSRPGEYGAGAVIVWDRGSIATAPGATAGRSRPSARSRTGISSSSCTAASSRGAFALTRTGTDGRGRERWLLVKKRDRRGGRGRTSRCSAARSRCSSGRTIEQLAAEAGWRPTRR